MNKFFTTWMEKKLEEKRKIQEWNESIQWQNFYNTLEYSKKNVLKEQQEIVGKLPF